MQGYGVIYGAQMPGGKPAGGSGRDGRVGIRLGMRLGLLCASASLVAIAAPAAGGGVAAADARPRPGLRIDPPPVIRHAHAVPGAGSPWQELTHQPPFNPGAMILLTDGSVSRWPLRP